MVICENHSINVLKAPAAQAPAAALAPVKSLTTGQNDISYLTLLLLKGCFPERKKKFKYDTFCNYICTSNVVKCTEFLTKNFHLENIYMHIYECFFDVDLTDFTAIHD